jgi:RNA polymerase sigma-70 factor (ECF subfamily)
MRQGGQQVSEKESEFARVLATHRHALLRYALRRLDDHDDAEDLVADTFVVAWRRFVELPSRDQELFWLYGIEGRMLANSLRGRRRSMRLEMRLAFERENANDTRRYGEEDIQELMSALSQLKPEERELLQLTYWERLSYREIGAVLGCTERAAGIRISRARRHLRQLLDEVALTATIARLPNQETR